MPYNLFCREQLHVQSLGLRASPLARRLHVACARRPVHVPVL